MRLKVFRPSSLLANVELGDTFFTEDGKRYVLMSRNPWTATIARYTKLDEFVVKILDRIIRIFRKTK